MLGNADHTQLSERAGTFNYENIFFVAALK